MMRRVGGALLTVTGILFCPCHLIITLPLLTSLLAGTALGSLLTRNTGLVVTFASLYFIVALLLGFRLLFSPSQRVSRRDGACPTCEPGERSWDRFPSEDEVPTTRQTLPEIAYPPYAASKAIHMRFHDKHQGESNDF